MSNLARDETGDLGRSSNHVFSFSRSRAKCIFQNRNRWIFITSSTGQASWRGTWAKTLALLRRRRISAWDAGPIPDCTVQVIFAEIQTWAGAAVVLSSSWISVNRDISSSDHQKSLLKEELRKNYAASFAVVVKTVPDSNSVQTEHLNSK